MNKHFHDSACYLKRAAHRAKRAVLETVEPVTERVRSLLGREPEPETETGRGDTVPGSVRELETRARDEARDLAAGTRAKFGPDRTSD